MSEEAKTIYCNNHRRPVAVVESEMTEKDGHIRRVWICPKCHICVKERGFSS